MNGDYIGMIWKKNVIIFLLSQTLSLFGSALVQYAITWYITLETQSGTMMTISIIAGFLPSFILSPFAGVWADRFCRRNVIAFADSLIAISTLLLAILFFMGYRSIWLLFIVSAVRSVGTGIQSPAVSAFIPQIVPEENLTKVNGINGSIQSFVMLLAPMVSGGLLSVAPIESIFFIDVVTAALAVGIVVFFLHVAPHEKAILKQDISYLEDLKSGLQYISRQGYLRKMFVFCAVFFFFSGPVAFLTPLQVTRSFGDDVWRLTVIEVTFSCGMMFGGLLLAYWGGFKNRIYTMTLSSIVIGISTASFGIIPDFWLYAAIMGVLGLIMPLFNTPAIVLLQEKVAEDYMGRVFGVLNMIISVTMPVGMLLFGPISDVVPIEQILIVTGILMCVVGILLVVSKDLVEAGKQKLIEERIE
ncbi:MAG: transporter [Lachnospiraceae bacterium]|jgi:DHA3 family macrolide efflux protein-like MFS transporter|nr:transporter [Lachnospiraceae bacterium]